MKTLFDIPVAQEAKIVRPVADKTRVTTFQNGIDKTLEKIRQSLSDARGRYEEGKSYANPKPSVLWDVTKEADRLEDEIVTVKLKVGIRKLPIDGEATEIKIPSTALVPTLEAMEEMILSIQEQGRETEQGKAFHEVCILAFKPTTNADNKVYDAKADLWVEREELEA